MPAHLRVSLADRPGALATLTRALAAVGANVNTVTVLQREAGRAVDDVLLEWPFARPWDAVIRAVEGCPGARLHGLRHVTGTEALPDYQMIQAVLRHPERALERALDLLPAALLADWAAVADRRWPREPVLASAHSPLPLPIVPAALPRPRALVVDDQPVLALPSRDGVLRVLIGRCGGPGFTRTERERAAALLELVLSIEELAKGAAAIATPA
jgi:hypothetical protein